MLTNNKKVLKAVAVVLLDHYQKTKDEFIYIQYSQVINKIAKLEKKIKQKTLDKNKNHI